MYCRLLIILDELTNGITFRGEIFGNDRLSVVLTTSKEDHVVWSLSKLNDVEGHLSTKFFAYVFDHKGH